MPERQLDAPECGYVEAQEARQQAQQNYDENERTHARASRLRESRRTLEAASRREADAKDCEQRARDWSDLSAQWQSARAAADVREIAFAQSLLTIGEIVALLATIWVGIWAVNVTRQISKDEIAAADIEAAAAAQRGDAELAEAKRATEVTRAIGEAQLRAWLHFDGCGIEKQIEVNVEARTATVVAFRLNTCLKNTGATPALQCVSFTGATLLGMAGDDIAHPKVKALMAEIEKGAGDKSRDTTAIFPNSDGTWLVVDGAIPAADFRRWIARQARLFAGFAVRYRTLDQVSFADDRVTCMALELICGATENEFMNPANGTEGDWFKAITVPGTTKIT